TRSEPLSVSPSDCVFCAWADSGASAVNARHEMRYICFLRILMLIHMHHECSNRLWLMAGAAAPAPGQATISASADLAPLAGDRRRAAQERGPCPAIQCRDRGGVP